MFFAIANHSQVVSIYFRWTVVVRNLLCFGSPMEKFPANTNPEQSKDGRTFLQLEMANRYVENLKILKYFYALTFPWVAGGSSWQLASIVFNIMDPEV